MSNIGIPENYIDANFGYLFLQKKQTEQNTQV
jgi:hypothetical protein